MLSSKQAKQSKLLTKCLSEVTIHEHLFPFLKAIEFDCLRRFIHQQLCNTSENIHSCLPLTYLLHENVIQHILSVANITSTSCVCKKFDHLCQQNAIQRKKRFFMENKNNDNTNDVDKT